MTINQRLFEIMSKQGIRQTELANALNIKQQIINNWKTRGTDPAMEYLPKICETLNISWEYLVTGQDNKETITREERQLIEEFRKANEKGRKKIIEYAEEMKNVYPAELEKEMIS